MKIKKPKYNNGVELWQCCTCKKWLTKDKFYQDNRRLNGIKSQCKICHTKTAIETRDKHNTNRIRRESMRNARTLNPKKYRTRDRLASKKRPKDIKYQARMCLNNAVRDGIVSKPKKCSKCGKIKKLTAHHDDYTKPLDVKWLCYECHGNK